MNMDIRRKAKGRYGRRHDTPRRGWCGVWAEARFHAPRPRHVCELLEGRTLLSAAGDLDTSFSQDGLADFRFANGVTVTAYEVDVQGDGKTVIVGTSSSGGFAVARLNIDGTPDPTFGPDFSGAVVTPVGDFQDEARATAVAIQPDGKILVAGRAKLDESLEFDDFYFGVVRYLPDGRRDDTFAGDGIRVLGEGGTAEDVILQNDWKILVFGSTSDEGDCLIARLNPNGSTDGSFDDDGLRSFGFGGDFDEVSGRAVALDSEGRIVVVGSALFHRSRNRAVALARMNPDGSLDGSFDGDGRVVYRHPGRITTEANDVRVQPGGKVLVIGHTTGNNTNDFLLLRFNPDGQLDPTFGGTGAGAVLTDFDGRDDRASSIISNFDGDRLLVAGSADGIFALARYTNDGVLDTAFQGDGKLLTPFASGLLPELTRGPGRRFVAAGGPDFHAVRYLDDGANLVTIGSLDPNAAEAGQEPAHFIVGRIERLPTPLRVFLDISGAARRPGLRPFQPPDYLGEGISFGDGVITRTFVDIPAGATFASVIITPQDDALAEGDETAVFSIRPDPSYDVATPAATLEILDDDASTLHAAADAHVRGGDFAPSNFGDARFLETRLAPGDASQNRETYIKFDVGAVNGNTVQNARLRVFGRQGGDVDGGPAVRVLAFGVPFSGWLEGTITDANKPPSAGPARASASVVGTTPLFYDFDVTAFLKRERAAGRSQVTLLLRNAAASAAETLWLSRQASGFSDPRLIVSGGGGLAGPGPPAVTQVFVNGTAWTQAFRQSLEDAGLGDNVWGYAVGDGPAQLDALPWHDIDQVSIRFNRDVDVQRGDLSVRGMRTAAYAVGGFGYDPAGSVATWTLTSSLGGGAAPGSADRVLLDLDGDGPGGVTSAPSGVLLDGEWANGADAYDSGDGTVGGDFRFRLNVLPGDVNQSGGAVNAGDLVLTRNRVGRGVANPDSGTVAYSVLNDVNGDGIINAIDLVLVRNRVGSTLPQPPITFTPLFSATRVLERDEEGGRVV